MSLPGAGMKPEPEICGRRAVKVPGHVTALFAAAFFLAGCERGKTHISRILAGHRVAQREVEKLPAFRVSAGAGDNGPALRHLPAPGVETEFAAFQPDRCPFDIPTQMIREAALGFTDAP